MSQVDIYSMKCELAIGMQEVAEARHHFIMAQQAFERHGIRESRSFMSGIVTHFEKALENYFKALCQELTNEHADGTPAEVELDSRFYSFERGPAFLYYDDEARHSADECHIKREAWKILEAVDSEGCSPSAQTRAMCEALDYANWEGIKSSLDEQIKNLASAGRRLVADTLVKQLSMKNSFHEPKFKSGRFIFTTYSVSWMHHHDKIREIHKLIDALSKVTSETGIVFGFALQGLVSELNGLGFEKEKVASRTTICKGDPVEVRCFKEKYEYRFTPKAFEAIQAFISMYGDDEAIDAVMNTAQLSQLSAA